MGAVVCAKNKGVAIQIVTKAFYSPHHCKELKFDGTVSGLTIIQKSIRGDDGKLSARAMLFEYRAKAGVAGVIGDANLSVRIEVNVSLTLRTAIFNWANAESWLAFPWNLF